jgi:nitrite reductase/ring-hydroxylating ferredoxin subunit
MYSEQLFPHPSSWYCVALSSELPPGSVLGRVLAGRELVLFRTASGALGAMDAHCPHLGAHLAKGGRVEGECLRCPFHGFSFDTRGACVKTGYDTRPPPKATARAWSVRELHGMVFVWFDVEGQAPSWQLPDVDTDSSDWTALRHRTLRFRGHVQEIAENGVDIGHFSYVHGFQNVRQTRELVTQGPYLSLSYSTTQHRQVLGASKALVTEFDIHQHGLGYARVEVVLPDMGIRARQFIMARPVNEDEVEMVLGVSVRKVESSARVHPLMTLAPRGWLTEVLAETNIRELELAVQQDVPIWSHKKFIHPPALAQGDGPIGAYRQWVRQFYPAARRREAAVG